MAEARKLEKLDVDGASSRQSGTRRMGRFDLLIARPLPISMATPIESILPATLEAAKPSLPQRLAH